MQDLRGRLRSLPALLRGTDIVQALGCPDKSEVRECLREIAKLPLRIRIVFFRSQANIVS